MGGEEDMPSASAYYRAYGMPRWALLAGLGGLSVVAVVGIVRMVVGHVGGDSLAGSGGFLVWCIGVLALSAVYLGPTALELVLAEDELLWQSPLLSGHVALADVDSVRPFGPFGVLAVVSTATRPRVLVWATAGFADFMDDLTTAAPHVRVRHGRYQRTGDWLSGRRTRPGGSRRSDDG